MALFYVAFVFVGSFFLFNLLVGVVVDHYNTCRSAMEGTMKMSDAGAGLTAIVCLSQLLFALSAVLPSNCLPSN